MTSNRTSESGASLAHEADALWSMPWHARLKNLAEEFRPSVAHGRPVRPAGSVHTWLERARTPSTVILTSQTPAI